eukprot:4494407-Amphidinium_carterae.1
MILESGHHVSPQPLHRANRPARAQEACIVTLCICSPCASIIRSATCKRDPTSTSSAATRGHINAKLRDKT